VSNRFVDNGESQAGRLQRTDGFPQE